MKTDSVFMVESDDEETTLAWLVLDAGSAGVNQSPAGVLQVLT